MVPANGRGPFVGCREAGPSLVTRSKFRKSPKAVKKALGLFSYARRTFLHLPTKTASLGLGGSPGFFRISDLDALFSIALRKPDGGNFKIIFFETFFQLPGYY